MPGKKPEPEKEPGPSFVQNHQLEARRLEARRLKARLQYQLELLEGAREERKVVALESIATSLVVLSDQLTNLGGISDHLGNIAANLRPGA